MTAGPANPALGDAEEDGLALAAKKKPRPSVAYAGAREFGDAVW